MEGYSESTFAYFFLSLFIEGLPYILLGTVLSGFIDVYVPARSFERFLPRNRVLAVLVSGLLGVILPVCECAVVPVIRRLLGKGLPLGCAFTYMLAAPIVNGITMFSTWTAFQGQGAWMIMWSRMGLGYLVAIIVGLLMLRLPAHWVLKRGVLRGEHDGDAAGHGGDGQHEHGCDHEHQDGCGHVHGHGDEHHACGHDHHEDEVPRVLKALRYGMKDFIEVAVYFSVGVILTTLFNLAYVDFHDELQAYAASEIKGTLLLMGLAFLLSVCSTSDAFLAASLGGFAYVSKMAFMVFGPMLDVKLLFLYQTLMNRRFLLVFSIALFLLVALLCLLWGQMDTSLSYEAFDQGKEGLC
ncbi:permease [Rubritalea marina]|uniref:permease n=1 Tax=Rubritalea marina TaxID=361055 RepID=UPI00035F1102|nr:permease [Rubritalea marina]